MRNWKEVCREENRGDMPREGESSGDLQAELYSSPFTCAQCMWEKNHTEGAPGAILGDQAGQE
jgi:hypothetical protein